MTEQSGWCKDQEIPTPEPGMERERVPCPKCKRRIMPRFGFKVDPTTKAKTKFYFLRSHNSGEV